mmetsp:Transcript_77157/g.216595  ORF Transcript_77157/g.216595 Transcript_77157/m.216595 type:complete len:207 (-) Transcript_77157:363-983(-)
MRIHFLTWSQGLNFTTLPRDLLDRLVELVVLVARTLELLLLLDERLVLLLLLDLHVVPTLTLVRALLADLHLGLLARLTDLVGLAQVLAYRPGPLLAVLAHLLALALLSASQRIAARRCPAHAHDVGVHLDLGVEFQHEPRVLGVVGLLAVTGSLGRHGPTPSAHVRSTVPAARMQATSRPLSPSHPRSSPKRAAFGSWLARDNGS